MEYFNHPLGVLLFNRPHLAKFVLRSLKESNLYLKEESLIFHLDGYEGSKFQAESEKDRTGEIEKLVRKYFPKSHVIKQDKNIGIAKSFYTIMDYVFHEFNSDIAVFQEEDVFLYPYYFELMDRVIRETKDLSWIGALSINNIDHYQNNAPGFVVPTFGTRELAIKKQVFIEGKDAFNSYLQSLGPSYRTKKLDNINLALSEFGMKLKGPNQDVFQHEMIRHQDRLHLRINIRGSFQANLSSGESIPGLPILDLAKECFKLLFSKKHFKKKESIEYSTWLEENFQKLAKLDRDYFVNYEDRLRAAGINWPAGGKVKKNMKTFNLLPNVEKLIVIRNKTGLSKIKYFLESLIISWNLNKFRSL